MAKETEWYRQWQWQGNQTFAQNSHIKAMARKDAAARGKLLQAVDRAPVVIWAMVLNHRCGPGGAKAKEDAEARRKVLEELVVTWAMAQIHRCGQT